MEQSDYIHENIEEAKNLIEATLPTDRIGLILGSGLGGVVDAMSDTKVLPYKDIPHFPTGNVEGHAGALVSGQLGGKRVLAMQGRFHYYEGYTMSGVVFPVRVMARLGIDRLIVTNAAGGLRMRLRPGDFVIVEDHLNFMGANPLVGPNDASFGPRFLDMSDVYSRSLVDGALGVARQQGLRAVTGVLAAVSGPTYETPAEAAFLRGAGADIVTMSTVPEVIAGRHSGMEILCLSCVTNVHGRRKRTGHEEVLAASAKAAKGLAAWLDKLISTW